MTEEAVDRYNYQLLSVYTRSLEMVERHDTFLQRSGKTKSETVEIPREGLAIAQEIMRRFSSVEDQEVIGIAFSVASWAHANQRRKTGEAYIHHPLWVAHQTTTHHVSAEATAAYLLHDVLEDSIKPNGNLVTKDDLKNILPSQRADKILSIVDGLTELKTYDNPLQTFEHLYRASMKDPLVLLGKLYDRMHNLLTIHGQPPAKQYEKAIQTVQALLPIAKLFGFRKEARILGDLAYSILDTLQYGSSHRVQELQNRMNQAYTEERQQDIYNFFSTFDNFHSGHFRLSAPGMYELSTQRTVETSKETIPDVSDCWYNLELAIPQQYYNSQATFALHSNLLIQSLHFHQDSALSIPKNSGIESALSKARNEQALNGLEYTVLFTHRDGSVQPIRIKMYPEQLYHQITTPLSVIDADTKSQEIEQYQVPLLDSTEHLEIQYAPSYYRPLSFGNAQQYAKQSLENIKTFVKEIDSDTQGSWDRFLERVQLAQPDGLKVIGINNRQEQIPVFVPPNSTLLDYALLWLPQRWRWITYAEINGVKVDNLSTPLSANDHIHFYFAKQSEQLKTIQPYWLSSTKTVTQKLPELLQELHDRETRLRVPGKEQALEEFLEGMMLEGQKRLMSFLDEPIGSIRLIQIPRVRNMGITPEELLLKIAYRDPEISEEILEKIAAESKECWNKQIKWEFEVTDSMDRSGIAALIFDELSKSGLILTTYADPTLPFSHRNATLQFWFDPDNQFNTDFERKIKQVKMNISMKLYSNQ